MILTLNGKELEKEENHVYLGVNLDARLSKNDFMKELKNAAVKRLNLVKRLAGTTWGTEKRTLRQLYIGYIRAKLDYCSPIQTVANKSALQEINKVHNQGLRLICGAMRSTPTAACEIDANIEPLDIRRNRSLVEAVERYHRAEPMHPNRQLVENWKPNRRLQQQSPLDISNHLSNVYNLSTDRKEESRSSSIIPWQNVYVADIKTSLLDDKINKNSPAAVLKTSTNETIDSYPKTAIQAFTDGSAFKATVIAGFGVHLKFPDRSSQNLSEPCGNICSNYTAEIKAMTSAVEFVHQLFETGKEEPTDLVIFSDSQSALEALENQQSRNVDILRLAQSIDNLHKSYKVNIMLQWVPGHSDITGNEIADKLAKQGASKEQPNIPVDQETTKQILRNISKEEWYNRWALGTTGRAVFREMSRPKSNDNINFLNRLDQYTIFHLRTGHGKTNAHLNRIDPAHPPLCRNCTHPYETTKHILFECPRLVNERRELLPPFPTVQNTLYTTKSQLQNTSMFFRLAMTVKE